MWYLILKMAYNLPRFFLKPFRAIPLDCSHSTNLGHNIYTVDNPFQYTYAGREVQLGVLLTSFPFTKGSTQLLTSPELKISHQACTFLVDQLSRQALPDAPKPTAQRGYRSCMPALGTVLSSQYCSSHPAQECPPSSVSNRVGWINADTQPKSSAVSMIKPEAEQFQFNT